MVEVANQIFPPGLVQALGGDDKLGPTFVNHPDVHKISFTGSIATGKRIMAAAAQTLKRVTLELGGNDPAIVLPDADITKVAPLVAMVGRSPNHVADRNILTDVSRAPFTIPAKYVWPQNVSTCTPPSMTPSSRP